MLVHDLPQERQPVHAGHLNIQGDHVRHLLGDPLGSHEGIARRADYLDGRVSRQHLAQRLADQSGIVDDEDPNSRLAHSRMSPIPGCSGHLFWHAS